MCGPPSSHSVWHIPSKSHVTCDTVTWLPIRGRHQCHVTSGQPIRGWHPCHVTWCVTWASALSGEWSIWSLIRVTMILCVNQGSGDTGGGTFAQPSDTAQFQDFYIKRYFKENHKVSTFLFMFPFQFKLFTPHTPILLQHQIQLTLTVRFL